MKQTLFAETISPRKRKAFHQWFWCSCITIMLLVIILMYIYMQQYYYLQSLLKEHQRLEPASIQLQTILVKKRKLKEDEATLKSYHAKMARNRHKCKHPAQVIDTLLNLNDHNISLQILDLKKKEISMTLNALNTQQIIKYVQLLSKQPLFTSIEITKIEPTAQQVKAYVEAKLS